MSSMRTSVSRRRALGSYGAFFLLGIANSAWLSRLPTIKDDLQVSAFVLALIVSIGSIGSLAALLFVGRTVERLGARSSQGIAAVVWCAGSLTVAAAVGMRLPVAVAGGLFVSSAAVSLWGTSMNMEAKRIEQDSGRSFLPRANAAFSAGVFCSVLTGSGLSRLGLPVAVHLGTVAISVFVLLLLATSAYATSTLTPAADEHPGGVPRSWRIQARVWLEGATIALGLVSLAAEVAEGTIADWGPLMLTEEGIAVESDAVLVIVVFNAAMIIVRITGTRIIDRFGARRVLGVSLAVATIGVLTFVLSPNTAWALAAAAVWGAGCALCDPIVVSLTPDGDAAAPYRLAVISAISYGAFLIVPPLLGMLADLLGFRVMIGTVAVLLVGAITLIPAIRGVGQPSRSAE